MLSKHLAIQKMSISLNGFLAPSTGFGRTFWRSEISPYLRSSANIGSKQRRKVTVLLGKLGAVQRKFVYMKE